MSQLNYLASTCCKFHTKINLLFKKVEKSESVDPGPIYKKQEISINFSLLYPIYICVFPALRRVCTDEKGRGH